MNIRLLWTSMVVLSAVLAFASLINVIVRIPANSSSEQLDDSSDISCLECVRFMGSTLNQTPVNVNTTVECLMTNCSHNQGEISAVLGAVIDKQDSDQRRFKHFLDSKVYLRQMMVPTDSNDLGAAKLKFYTSEIGSTEYDVIRVPLSSDEVYIPQSGLYYVSSAVLFQINDSGFYSEGYNKTLKYTVRFTRQTKPYSQVLYQIFFRCCTNCVEILESKYYGGVFELEEGDIIDSFISHADTVKHVYLNLYLLQSLHGTENKV